ncbi:hypothetical protein NV379_13700 [Paenibacillus sp. N1-5-1-14]|uniref:hypothetical protein n=1 Tax=Paenibacillus radicibacter TaxID=2972488 RepID=UPI002159383A|nr:hypothetical protein [Paenibacillus radicibacter]MCR8643707.1 hypothetical protein [Paenibacillus radicibacter]
MSKSSATNWRMLLAAFSLFVCGGVVGAAVFMSTHQFNFDKLVTENDQLRRENKNITDDNDNLMKYQKNNSLIKLINVYYTNDSSEKLNESIQEELKKRVKNELKIIRGQRISSANRATPVYEKLISDKTFYNVFEKNYRVQVKFIELIGTELNVWFTAKEAPTNPPR